MLWIHIHSILVSYLAVDNAKRVSFAVKSARKISVAYHIARRTTVEHHVDKQAQSHWTI